MRMNLHTNVFLIPARCYTIEIPNTVLDVWKAGCIFYLGKVGSRSSAVVGRNMLSRIVGSSIRSTVVTNYFYRNGPTVTVS